jgi:hypothetical protein
MSAAPDCLSHALAHGRQGRACFPVAADGRSPLIKGGCHSASTDPARLTEMFSRPCNLAIATGAPSGVLVLDVDCKGADGNTTLAALEVANGALPETWEVLTPSGGRHLYFVLPDRPHRNRVGFAPGLDVRTTGGSVCAPPSRRADGDYRWKRTPSACGLAALPEWLFLLIAPPEVARPVVAPLRVDSRDRAARYVISAVEGECGAVAKTPANSGRNHRLFVASAKLGELVGGGLLPEDVATSALELAAEECGLGRDDGWHSVRATIQSGLRRGFDQPRMLEVGR